MKKKIPTIMNPTAVEENLFKLTLFLTVSLACNSKTGGPSIYASVNFLTSASFPWEWFICTSFLKNHLEQYLYQNYFCTDSV